MKSSKLRLSVMLGAAMLLLTSSAALATTAVLSFDTSQYGVANQDCNLEPLPPLFNYAEYGYQTKDYIAGTPDCGEGDCNGTNGSDSFLTNLFSTTGDNSEEIRFSWQDPTNGDSWLRLVAFSAGGVDPHFQSPTVHLGIGSKISMDIMVYGTLGNEDDLCAPDVPGSQLEFSLIIRETGLNLPLGENGGMVGEVEFVGVDTIGGPVIDPATPNGGVALQTDNYDFYTVTWEFVDAGSGVVGVQVTVDDGVHTPVTTAKSIVGFGEAGDGVLSAPYDRGTLDSLAIRKPAGDTTTAKWFVNIDNIVIDAPDVTDPVQVEAPVLQGPSQSVTVSFIDPSADAVTLYKNDVFLADTTSGYSTGSYTFTGLVLAAGDKLTATQTIDSVESDPSAPVYVLSAVMWSDNFDTYLTQADFESVWVNADHELATDQAASCPNSAKQPASTSGIAYVDLETVAGPAAEGLNGTDELPLWITWYFRHEASANQRNFFQIRSYTSGTYAGGGLTHLYHMGCYNGYAPTGNYWGRDVYDGAPTTNQGWFDLGVAHKNNVWVKMQIKLAGSTTEYWIDDTLAASTPRYGNDPVTTLILGAGLSNNGIPAWYDNVSVSLGASAIDPFGPPNSLPVPTLVTPISPGDTEVTVSNLDAGASEVRVYGDGNLLGSASLTGETTKLVTVNPAIGVGMVVTARQVIGVEESCADSVTVLLPVPAVDGPVIVSDTEVTVSNIDPAATTVKLYKNGDEIAFETADFSTTPSFTFTSLSLAEGDILTATQIIGGFESTHSESVTVVSGVTQLLWSESFDSYADQAAFDAVWLADGTLFPFELATDAAATCPNSAKEPAASYNYPQKRYLELSAAGLTDVNGTDASPLWLTWYFRHENNTNQRNYVQWRSDSGGTYGGGLLKLYILGCYNGVAPTTNYSGRDYGLTGPGWFATDAARNNDAWVKLQIELTSSTTKYYVDGELAYSGARYGATTPITSIVLGSGLSNSSSPAWFDNFSISTGYQATDPFGYPLPVPTVVGPIDARDQVVTVTDLDPDATEVQVYGNGLLIGSEPLAQGETDKTVNTIAPIGNGTVVTAKQVINSNPSCDSSPVVAALPTPSVQSPLVNGDVTITVTGIDPAATEVRVLKNGSPLTSATTPPEDFSSGSYTFTVSTLAMGEVITATQVFTEGESDASAPVTVTTDVLTSLWADNFDSYADQAAFDAVWQKTSGTEDFELAIDQAISCPNSAKQPPATIDPYRRYVDLVTVAGLTDVNGTDTVPLWITWYFRHEESTGQRNYIQLHTYSSGTFAGGGLTQLYSMGCYNATAPGNYAARDWDIGWMDLGVARLNNTWVKLQIKFTSSFTEYYVNDVMVKSTVRNGVTEPITTIILGSGLTNAGTAAWFDHLSVSTGPYATDPAGEPLAAPTVVGPLNANAAAVTLQDIDATASLVTVLANGTPIGSANPAGATELEVPVSPSLVKGEIITAKQSVGGSESCPSSTGQAVGSGANGGILLALGIRENETLVGPVGHNGGTTGSVIEWLGASGQQGDAPIGKPILPSSQWQEVVFDPTPVTGDPVLSFNLGDNQLQGTYGVLEHLAITANPADLDAGPYRLYIDNIESEGTVFADFEAFSSGDQVMFRQPSFSSTTSGNLAAPPNVSVIDTGVGEGGGKSVRVEWRFLDEDPGRWIRLTTSNAPDGLPNPEINLTLPIKLRVLLQPAAECHDPFADADNDGDVDQEDFAAFQLCFTGVNGGMLPGYCSCFSRDFDNDVDQDDLGPFEDCASGPAVPAVLTCDD